MDIALANLTRAHRALPQFAKNANIILAKTKPIACLAK